MTDKECNTTYGTCASWGSPAGFTIVADDDVTECIKFVASKLKLNYSQDLTDYFSTRIKRDFLSIKSTIQDFDKFLYSEQKQPTKISAASFLKSLS